MVDAQGNTETITCTTEHPFWVPGQGWTAAGDLTPGTELTSPDGSMVTVVSNTVQVLAQPVNVYNFEVEGDHTYFVDQGGEPVWVHNWCDEEVVAAARNFAEGECEKAAYYIWKAADEAGEKASVLAQGGNGLSHFFTQIGGKIYDVTASQFVNGRVWTAEVVSPKLG